MKIFLTILLSMVIASCSTITFEQLQFAHAIYHTLTDEACIFIEKDCK